MTHTPWLQTTQQLFPQRSIQAIISNEDKFCQTYVACFIFLKFPCNLDPSIQADATGQANINTIHRIIVCLLVVCIHALCSVRHCRAFV